MKSRLSTAFLLSFLFVTTGDALKAQVQDRNAQKASPSSGSSSNATSETVPPAGWQRFSLGDDSFSVLLPKPPQENTERTKMGNMEMTVKTYAVEVDNGAYIFVYIPDFPAVAERLSEPLVDSFYEGVWKGFAEGVQKEMSKNGLLFKLEQSAHHGATVGGMKGREQDFTLGPLSGLTQATMTGRRAYMAITMWTEDMPTAERKIIFDSLRINPPPAVKPNRN